MLPIAVPSMPCEANRPLTSLPERNRNQTRAKNDPAFTMPACLLTVTDRCMRRWLCENGGGCTIRTHGRPEATGGFQNRCNKPLCQPSNWCAERIRTPDLLLMGQASYRTAPPRNFSSVFCQRTAILSHTSSLKSRAKNTPCRLWSAGRSAVAE